MTALTDALRALALHQDLPECAQAADEIEKLTALRTVVDEWEAWFRKGERAGTQVEYRLFASSVRFR